MRTSFILGLLVLLGSVFVPHTALAADGEVAGWIPYWETKDGMKDAKSHFDELDRVYLFAYTVKKDGSLNDLMGLSKSTPKRFIADARKAGVEVFPTVMWSDTTNIHNILSSTEKRKAHVLSIVAMAEKGEYDGIDIDYEGKKADTMPYFSLFLTELSAELHRKEITLSCSIEARTPADSLYTVVPGNLRYANDLAVIGKVCDIVNVMTYDQQRADLKANKARQGAPYYPVADPLWVEKVARLMTEVIPKEKMMLGVATYGREVEVTVSPDWYQGYKQLWSVNPKYAKDQAKKAKVTPSRNAAGEMSYTYLPKKSKLKLSSYKAPSGTPSGNQVAAKALAYANATGKTATFNMVWWSDGEAVGDKAELARSLGLRGISIFKIDGGEDSAVWKNI
ncbi:MAG: hypothetical protein KBC38_02330 [Candidatus Pacebacteria bacterium]|nr:hypothetical protein [Candidatus Paceibacterota bacterium]MBP9840638.1 hypothetical protein [Candidatus Paceibacterota bacterium]